MNGLVHLEHLTFGTEPLDWRQRSRWALFDYDGTIVRPKDGRPFPKNSTDFEFTAPSVPNTLQRLYADGHRILIFTHQSKTWKRKHIINALTESGLECADVFITWYHRGKALPPWSKPHKALWDEARKLCPSLPEALPPETVFVGDAAGRQGDHTNSDLFFARNLGVQFQVPEDYFPRTFYYKYPKKDSVLVKEPCLVILCGSPASGKTTFSKWLASESEKEAVALHGDDFKSRYDKMYKAAEQSLPDKTVILDATFRSRKHRDEARALAAKYQVPFYIVYSDATRQVALKLNRLRPKPVSDIAIHSHFSHLELLDEDEPAQVLSVTMQ